ncbi:MAG: hypothetical protein GY754_14485 [bacterium]|nr:hypothetical protein [bacterium]
MLRNIFIIPGFLLLLFSASVDLYAENTKSPAAGKSRVAVLDFNAVNTPEFLAKTITDLFSAGLFELKLFTMIERSEMEQILKEQELQKKGCTDSVCAVTAGKALSAQKIILGTIHKMEDYKIFIKIIDVATGEAESIYIENAAHEDDIEPVLASIINKIKEDYTSAVECYLQVSLAAVVPTGDFSGLSNFGYGANLDFSVNNLVYKNVPVLISSGFYYFGGNSDAVRSIMMIPFSINLGYRFPISGNISVIPYLGGGYMMELMSYDRDGIRNSSGKYEYSRDFFFDPLISGRIDIVYQLTHSFRLYLSPAYTFFLEKNSSGQYFGIGFGLQMKI